MDKNVVIGFSSSSVRNGNVDRVGGTVGFSWIGDRLWAELGKR